MNRTNRACLARETLAIVESGGYKNRTGHRIDLTRDIEDTIQKSVLYTPEELDLLLSRHEASEAHDTRFDVTNETTLSAARRRVHEEGPDRVLCLNFASAKNPGGGFLGGSQAQEESLARSSALHATLTAQPEYYERNRACGTVLYTDHMILSPDVPVFRDDDGALLDEPYRVSFITTPAVNAGAVRKNEPGNVERIGAVMTHRMEKLLAVGESRGYRHLVLGAWGCGVFRHSPQDVARMFRHLLTGSGEFAGCFETITFAVLDRSEECAIIRAFETCFHE